MVLSLLVNRMNEDTELIGVDDKALTLEDRNDRATGLEAAVKVT